MEIIGDSASALLYGMCKNKSNKWLLIGADWAKYDNTVDDITEDSEIHISGSLIQKKLTHIKQL